MDPGALVERILDRPIVVYVRDVLDTYGRAAGGLLANGLAFAALFASVPTALVALGLAGWLADDPEVQAALAEILSEIFPPLADLIDASLDALVEGAALTSILGVIGLIWTVSQLYVTLDVAFARIFAQERERDLIGRTARGFVWVALLIAGVIVAILAISLSTAIDALLPNAPGGARSAFGWIVSPVGLFLAAFGALLVVYRTLPPQAPAWAAIWPPAGLVAFAIVLLSQAFAFLAPRLLGGTTAIVGSLATVFVALAWLSFSFQALLYGAAWVRVRNDRRRRPAGSGLAGTAASTEPGSGGE
jgi:YihY family inner membrane protein